MFSKDDWQVIDNIIDLAFEEDIRDGDATTNALFQPEEQSSAFMKVKDNGILCGIGVAERVFRRLDKDIAWKPLFQDGDAVSNGQIILEIKGSRRAILTGERLALNLMQRMSGIASMADRYVKARGDLPVQILDTRKTLPGLRVLEKYAVAIGGGTNHRYGLFDAIMIKDNHIKLAGGIRTAVNKVRENNPKKLTIEVETSSLAEVDEALAMDVDIIMLDNMSTEMMREAVQKIAGRSKVEASGGVTIERIREIAETGVDCISVGALTHSVQALDIGLYFRDI
ncbi:MAG: carboxylating nicotinate-nucleotide diphosphorylase [Calditrichia bacterium]